MALEQLQGQLLRCSRALALALGAPTWLEEELSVADTMNEADASAAIESGNGNSLP